MILLIDNKKAAIKEGSSFEYISANRLFQDRDDYSMSIELPLDCPENRSIFGNISRKDVRVENIFFDAEIIANNFRKSGAAVITDISESIVKVQFLEKRSYQNFYPDFDKKYIDELDLGAQPLWYPDNHDDTSGGMTNNPPRPGYPDPSQSDQSARYISPAEAWGSGDIIALPWVNNTSGNIQNRADAVNNTYKWHVVQDDDNDTEIVRGLSCQARLYYIVQLVCDALGYQFRGEDWRNSEYYHLYSFNTQPFAWGGGTWQGTLPHWTLNEFFEQIERLLLCEFDINHKAKCITFSWSNSNVEKAGEVCLENIVDEFSTSLSRGDESGYKALRNIGYADGGHEMWNFYSCHWYFKNNRYFESYDTLQDFFDALHKGITFYNVGRRDTNSHNTISASNVYYVADVDTYFILYGILRVKTGFRDPIRGEVYDTVYRLIPLNSFGNRVSDAEHDDETEEIGIVPVWIDDTMAVDSRAYKGELVFMDIGETDNTASSGEEYSYYRRPNATVVSQDTLIQTPLTNSIKNGDDQSSSGRHNNLQVGFWFGDFSGFFPYLPHPFIDTFDTKVFWQLIGTDLVHTFSKIDSGHNASLRINNRRYGQGKAHSEVVAIDGTRKYEFSFLYKGIPDVRAVFIIRGQKYLCSQIKTDINESDMSQLKKGTFYRILE